MYKGYTNEELFTKFRNEKNHQKNFQLFLDQLEDNVCLENEKQLTSKQMLDSTSEIDLESNSSVANMDSLDTQLAMLEMNDISQSMSGTQDQIPTTASLSDSSEMLSQKVNESDVLT